MTEPLRPGSPAPDFSLEGSDGRTHRLRDELESAAVMLVFYPGNDTPG